MSFSKTLLIGVLCIEVYRKISEFIKKDKHLLYLDTIAKYLIFTMPIIFVLLDLFDFTISTMAMRIRMWSSAVNLWKLNPFVGGGLSSARSYFNANGGWYVQTHSSIFQILSENGLIALMIFLIIVIKLIDCRQFNKIGLLFIIFSFSYETIYLQFWPFVILVYMVQQKDWVKINGS